MSNKRTVCGNCGDYLYQLPNGCYTCRNCNQICSGDKCKTMLKSLQQQSEPEEENGKPIMKIDARTEKINAIKAIRQHCLDTFGVTPGLKESKDFIEQVIIPAYPTDVVIKGEDRNTYKAAIHQVFSAEYRMDSATRSALTALLNIL